MHTRSGISEVVIPPNSNLIGKTVREVRMRGVYGLAVLAIHRGGGNAYPGRRARSAQGRRYASVSQRLEKSGAPGRDPNFVVVTSEYPHQEVRRHKVVHALFFFIFALGLALFTDVRLALALLVGAMGMVVNGVLSMDEAYAAVHWPTMFLLASLIPLGQAVENTGAAAWIAYHIVDALRGVPQWVMQALVAIGDRVHPSHVGRCRRDGLVGPACGQHRGACRRESSGVRVGR
ncbi:MAG: TrkA C-terminal domain-containing protein [Gammaproteobacteria bacterium]